MGCKNYVNGYRNGTIIRYHAPNCGCGEGRDKQGHPHAELMAQYAEDAKTNAEPWQLWEIDYSGRGWEPCNHSPLWNDNSEYRRKPKTKLIHGVEVPDIGFLPEEGERYYYPDTSADQLINADNFSYDYAGEVRMSELGLCYPCTEEGKQAAILHAKSMLGMA